MKKLMLLAALLLCSGLLFAQTKEELAAQKAQQEQVKAEQKAAEKAKKDLANKLKKRKEKAATILDNGIVIEGYRLWTAVWQSKETGYITENKINDRKFIRLYSTGRFRSYKFASRPRLILDVTLKNEKEFYINYYFNFPRWYNMKQWAEGKISVATMEARFDDAPRFEMKVIDDQVGGGYPIAFISPLILPIWAARMAKSILSTICFSIQVRQS